MRRKKQGKNHNIGRTNVGSVSKEVETKCILSEGELIRRFIGNFISYLVVYLVTGRRGRWEEDIKKSGSSSSSLLQTIPRVDREQNRQNTYRVAPKVNVWKGSYYF